MGAYQGTTIVISDFKSLKHIGCVGAAEGPVSHSLTKKQIKGMKKWVLGVRGIGCGEEI